MPQQPPWPSTLVLSSSLFYTLIDSSHSITSTNKNPIQKSQSNQSNHEKPPRVHSITHSFLHFQRCMKSDMCQGQDTRRQKKRSCFRRYRPVNGEQSQLEMTQMAFKCCTVPIKIIIIQLHRNKYLMRGRSTLQATGHLWWLISYYWPLDFHSLHIIFEIEFTEFVKSV